MSRSYMADITCPKCHKTHPFRIWESINTQLDLDLKSAVRDRSAFLYECPDCGDKNYIDYGFLYHQMEDRIMVQYAQTDEDEQEIRDLFTNDKTGMFQHLKNDNYLIRIVRSQDELIEKLRLFDNNLDDRIVEIFKFLVFLSFREEAPDFKEITILYFEEDGKDFVQIIADGKTQGTAEMPRAFYDQLCTDYADYISKTNDDEFVINFKWAYNVVASKEG